MNINQALSYFPRRDNDDDEDKSDEKTDRYTYQFLSILAVTRTYCTEIEEKKTTSIEHKSGIVFLSER